MPAIFAKILQAFIAFFGKYIIDYVVGWVSSTINKMKRAADEKKALDQYNKSVAEKADLEKRVKNAEDLLNSGNR